MQKHMQKLGKGDTFFAKIVKEFEEDAPSQMFSKLLNACLQDVGFCHIIIHKIIFMHCLKKFPQNLSPRKLNRAGGNPKREEF